MRTFTNKQLSIFLLSTLATLQLATSAVQAGEQVYKIRIRDTAIGSLNQDDIFAPTDKNREEWVVLTVIDGKQVKVLHTTAVQDKILPFHRWFDHPAIAIRICPVQDFDQRNCQTTEGDTAILPLGQSIYNLSIDFKYSEGGSIYTRSVQVPKP